MTTFQDLAQDLQDRFRAVRGLTLDVDGVLTDGRLFYDRKGFAMQSFHSLDGWGINAVQAIGIQIAIISGRSSEAAVLRSREIGIRTTYQGVQDKSEALSDFCKIRNLTPELIAHVGDDIPDLAIFDRVGIAIAVPNGSEQVRAAADMVTSLPGGEGAVREVCDILLEAAKG